jgi:crotonobetainyl-CoA:carnitine CoA-transferase CaiB-like acyl-CoA transferase
MTSHHNDLPLTGIRVIDLTHNWAGPHATRLIADFGAEVIKVEYSRRLDGMRGASKEHHAYNHHPRWWQMNRNKVSITLDLKSPRDNETFRDLVAISDVVVENSRVGVMKRLGLGYDILKTIKPDLIFLSMPVFGQTGPEASYAGYGGAIEALSGMEVLTAYDKSSRPMRVKEMDVTNGVVGACAIMTALMYRQQTGEGQYIDLSQLEAATTGLIGDHLLEYVMNGAQTLPLGNRHASYAPQGCYKCKGDDKWVVLVIRSDEEWEKFCEVLRLPELASDVRFATTSARVINQDELDHLIEGWTLLHTHYEVMHLLQQVGIAAGPVLNVEEIKENDHLKARGFFQMGQEGSDMLFPGMPFRLSEGMGEIRRPGPQLGEHNEYVLHELLGRSKEEIQPLTEDRIGTAFDIE